jgi:hypothetical protein
MLVLFLVACAPAQQSIPTVQPSAMPVPTATTQPTAYSGTVEGLVVLEDGQIVLRVDWLSAARVTYQVTGGDVERLRTYVGETVRVEGEMVDRSPSLKEVVVSQMKLCSAPDRLSMRVGYIKELGLSIYMQGTHVLTDREGKDICLLAAVEGGPDLNQYMQGQVRVLGVLEKTVEGDAQIMHVQLVEPVK